MNGQAQLTRLLTGEWAGQADTPPSLEQGECRGEDAEQGRFSN